MFKELGHFLWHAPATLWMQRKMTQSELYDALIGRLDAKGMAALRTRLVNDLVGDVLEIGCGTGQMFSHYRLEARLVAIEPDEAFREMGHRKAREASAQIDVLDGDATALAFESERFDAVVIAAVLCSIEPGKVETALAEVRRVLKPDGTLRLVEHVRSEKAVAGVMMDLVNPIWLWLNKQGCHLNRKTTEIVRQAGFEIVREEAHQFFAPGLPAFPFRFVHARPV